MNPVETLSVQSRPQGNAIVVRWVNPTDSTFVGVKLYRKRGGAISGQSDPDAVLIYDGDGTYMIDWGRDYKDGVLQNSVEYYYSIWAYDATPTYSTVVSATTKPEYSVRSDNIYIPTELYVILKSGLVNKGWDQFEIREANSIDPHELGEKVIVLIHPMDDPETQRNIGDESHSEVDPDDPDSFVTYIGGLYELSLIIRPISLVQPEANRMYISVKEILYEHWERLTAVGCISRQIVGMGHDDDLSGSIIAKPIFSRPLRITVGYDFLMTVKDQKIASVTTNYTYV